MTPAQFTRALSAAGMGADTKTAQALRLALLDGLSDNAAARAIGISPSAVTRARHRLVPRTPCTRCQGTGREPGEHA
jgi:DNA-directed RNA polymerase specialized sigma24 family protein